MIVSWGLAGCDTLFTVLLSTCWMNGIKLDGGGSYWSDECGMLVSNGGCEGSVFSGVDAIIVAAALTHCSVSLWVGTLLSSSSCTQFNRRECKGVSLLEENLWDIMRVIVVVQTAIQTSAKTRKANGSKMSNETNTGDFVMISSVTTCSLTTWRLTGSNDFSPTSDLGFRLILSCFREHSYSYWKGRKDLHMSEDTHLACEQVCYFNEWILELPGQNLVVTQSCRIERRACHEVCDFLHNSLWDSSPTSSLGADNTSPSIRMHWFHTKAARYRVDR